MARYRTYTIEFKRQVVEEHSGKGTGLNQLARRHDISRELLRLIAARSRGEEVRGRAVRERRPGQAGPAGLRGEDRRPRAQGRPAHQGARPAQKGADLGTPGERRDLLRRERPRACSVRAGCRVMSLGPAPTTTGRRGDRPRRWGREASWAPGSERSAQIGR